MERFVVGTGRCGSTLLSLMLAQHRDVVSLHEFFTGLDWGRRFAAGSFPGEDLADVDRSRAAGDHGGARSRAHLRRDPVPLRVQGAPQRLGYGALAVDHYAEPAHG